MDDPFLASAKRTLSVEISAIQEARAGLGSEFSAACRLIMQATGKVIVLGVGKSGHVGCKIAATLASTGTAAFFVHPTEAAHGDLGMIGERDLVIAISQSGGSDEVLRLLPYLKRHHVPIIAMTGRRESALAHAADVILSTQVHQEACPLGLAPTSSTTLAMVLGDALAIALLEARGFTREDFARFHPAGALGRRLLVKVDDVMRKGDAVPLVATDTPISDALLEMTGKGMGMTVVGSWTDVIGIYTDGDLRRTINRGIDLRRTPIADQMTVGPCTLEEGHLASEAASLMQLKKIHELIIVSSEGHLRGVLNVQDLLRAGVI